MRIALTGGNVIDGSGGPVRHDTSVFIEGGKIADVGRQHEFGPDVMVVDVSGKTIMPGLIDCHVHFAPWIQWLISEPQDYLMYMAGKTAYAMRSHLEAGCTAARDLGGLEAGWCQAVAEGWLPGPRLQTSLVIIQPTNGLTDHLPGVGGAISRLGMIARVPAIPTPWCDGPIEARKKVREVLRYGADIIKIANSGATFDKKLRLGRPLFTKEEVEAIVEEANTAGVQVTCHSNSLEGTLDAVRAGVNSIDHGVYLDEEIVAEMAKRGTWLVPTFTAYHWHATRNPSEDVRRRAKPLLETLRKSFALALKAGVRVVMGTDAAYSTGAVGIELKHMVDGGMTPVQAIEAGTGLAAECMGMQDQVGTLSVGKEADILVVDGDPLQDIEVVSHVEKLSLVMQAGKPVAGPMLSQFPWQASAPPIYWHE